MFRRESLALLIGPLLFGIGCIHKPGASSQLAYIDSSQPPKVLFDKAMDAMSHRKYESARLDLQALLDTYSGSAYTARAKMSLGDAWFAEGGPAALSQAESEYKDYIALFPGRPEAAEAQMKIADTHFEQMNKADRDFTQAKRAEEEYRQMLLRYPNSRLAERARIRLLQVQEVLAKREYLIGRFYYRHRNWTAAAARLKTLTDTYPLFSNADDALFLLGNAYLHLAQQARASKLERQVKTRLVGEYYDDATAVFSRIVSRYPVMPRASGAVRRLRAMNRPVPEFTPEAIARNKLEQASRGELGIKDRVLLSLHRRPDYRLATKLGEPTLLAPQTTSAAKLAQQVNGTARTTRTAALKQSPYRNPTANHALENQPIPRSMESEIVSSDLPAPAPPQINDAQDPASWTDGGNGTTTVR